MTCSLHGNKCWNAGAALWRDVSTHIHRRTHTSPQNVIWRTLAHAFVDSGCLVTNVSPVCHRKPSHLLFFFFFALFHRAVLERTPDGTKFLKPLLKRAEASARLLIITKPVSSEVTGHQSEPTKTLGCFRLLSSNINLPKYLAAL